MNAAVEWAYDFEVKPPDSETNHSWLADQILRTATAWAEQKEYGVGGGFRIYEEDDRARYEFSFGLTATREGQTIPRSDAAQLLDILKQFAAKQGAKLQGGWREFTESEKEPIPERT